MKIYCPNVGLVMDEDLELIAVYEERRAARGRTTEAVAKRGRSLT